MNEYMVTYTCVDEPGTFTQIVVDRTEAAAKKFFKSTAKEAGRKFLSIALVKTGVLSTKRNERETLEIIRQLVADLGPQSYLGTAFDGCFDDAEINIEDDLAFSMKARYEFAKGKVEELETQLKKAKQNIQVLIKRYDERDAAFERMSSMVLPADDLEDLRQLVAAQVNEAKEKAKVESVTIIQFAKTPDAPEFKEAVNMYDHYTSTAAYYQKILDRIVNIQGMNRKENIL